MENHQLNTSSQIRKPYQKPKIERVHLVAEEAVLAGCKNQQAVTGPTPGCGLPVDICYLVAS